MKLGVALRLPAVIEPPRVAEVAATLVAPVVVTVGGVLVVVKLRIEPSIQPP